MLWVALNTLSHTGIYNRLDLTPFRSLERSEYGIKVGGWNEVILLNKTPLGFYHKLREGQIMVAYAFNPRFQSLRPTWSKYQVSRVARIAMSSYLKNITLELEVKSTYCSSRTIPFSAST